MGTSKSYLPKVTKHTTQTKLNITKTITAGEIGNQKRIARIVNSFRESLAKDPSGLKNGNYIGAISAIGGAIASISSSSANGYIDQKYSDDERKSIKSPQDLFNRIILNEEYLTELEKANVLDAISQTLVDMNINKLEDLDSINCDLFFKTFLVNLIYSLFISSYYEHIDEKTNSPKETQDLCKEIKQYIEGKILSDNSLSVDLMNNQNKVYEVANGVVDEVLSLL